MTDEPARGDENRIKAAELHAAALEAEARQDYKTAVESYEQSLRLHDDPSVKAEYFKLLATIGPM